MVLLGVLVLMAGGYFTYTSLSSVVRMLQEETISMEGTTHIKDISTSFEKAENNIRLYGLTRSRVYYRRYDEAMAEIDSSMERLRISYATDTIFLSRVSTLDSLLGNMENLWYEMLFIWQTNATSEDLYDLQEEFRDTTVLAMEDTTMVIDTMLLQADSIEVKGLFKRRKRAEELQQMQQQQIQQQQEQQAQLREQLREQVKEQQEQAERNTVIMEKIARIAEEEELSAKKIVAKEKELASSSFNLNVTLIALMSQLEAYEASIEKQHLENANALEVKTYKLLALVSAIASLFSVVAFILLITYVRRNRAYNRILIKSKHETEELSKAKEQFMANVSHEIRTPLNAISGFVKQMLGGPVDPTVKEKLRIVDSAGDQLIRLINDVLDYSKLQAGMLSLHNVHFDPGHSLEKVCKLFYPLAEKKGNRISYDTVNPSNLVVFGDEHRFQQILYNLLSNSVKFTSNGRIDIQLDISREKKNQVLVELMVKDTGAGIDPGRINEVFNEYTQEDQETSVKYGGTGLGLSIVKSLAELYNGVVDLSSRKGTGTTVTCALFFDQGDRHGIPVEAQPDSTFTLPAGTRILIVDDEMYNRTLIAAILKKWQVEYDLAENGLEAVEKIKTKPFSHTLMDIRMTVMDGIEATRRIREQLDLTIDKLPIIGITADTEQSMPKEIRFLFNTLLVKPFSEEELYEVLISNPSDMNMQEEEDAAEGRQADLKNLVRISGNDMKFVREMILQFEQSANHTVEQMDVAVQQNDLNLVSDLAHSLMPAARHLGLSKLVMALKNCEDMARAGNTEEMINHFDALKQEAGYAITSCTEQYEALGRIKNDQNNN